MDIDLSKKLFNKIEHNHSVDNIKHDEHQNILRDYFKEEQQHPQHPQHPHPIYRGGTIKDTYKIIKNDYICLTNKKPNTI